MKIIYPVICKTHNTKKWVIGIVERWFGYYQLTYLWI